MNGECAVEAGLDFPIIRRTFVDFDDLVVDDADAEAAAAAAIFALCCLISSS